MLHTPVLSLAPDSLAQIGDLDIDSLSELWGVFTRVKGNLVNGHRLENLSWRLWHSASKESTAGATNSTAVVPRPAQEGESRDDLVRSNAATSLVTRSSSTRRRPDVVVEPITLQEGWSDPEWSETTDNDSDESDAEEQQPRRPEGRGPTSSTTNGTSQQPQRSTSSDSNVNPSTTEARPSLPARNSSKEFRSSSTISGGSIQRIITGFSSLPPISLPPKPRSVVDVTGTIRPSLLSPEHASAPAVVVPAPPPPSPSPSTVRTTSPKTVTTVDAPTQTSPTSSSSQRRASTTPAQLRSPPPPPAPSSFRSPATASSSTNVGPISRPMLPSHSSSSSTITTRATPSTSSTKTTKTPLASSSNLSRRTSNPKSTNPLPTSSSHHTKPHLISSNVSNTLPRTASMINVNGTSVLDVEATPRSFVKGFDTSMFEARPKSGSIAPPPTPATKLGELGPSPPKSALKTTMEGKGKAVPGAAAGGGQGKKIFFISSPGSDSEDGGSSVGSSRRSVGRGSSSGGGAGGDGGRRRSSLSKVVRSLPEKVAAPTSTSTTGKKEMKKDEEEDEWEEDDHEDGEEDDDDDISDDEDASSGWGSEYSTESDSPRRASTTTNPIGAGRSVDSSTLFAKRPSIAPLSSHNSFANANAVNSQLKPRPPGLLSQLFHPEMLLDDSDRGHSAVELTTRPRLSGGGGGGGGGSGLGLNEQGRTKSFLRGAPVGTEMESSSEEEEEEDDSDFSDSEDDDEDDYSTSSGSGSTRAPPATTTATSTSQELALASALARRRAQQERRLALEAAGPIAPPQTPRTTRRAMLATELSESLRRNLLWERQTRNRVFGRFNPPPAVPPTMPPTTKLPSPVNGVAMEGGLRAPHPSPATRDSSPVHRAAAAAPQGQEGGGMVRRHTTGTGLYLQAQMSSAPSRTSSQRKKERRGSDGGRRGKVGFTLGGGAGGESDGSASESETEDEDDGGGQGGGGGKEDVYGSGVWGQRVW